MSGGFYPVEDIQDPVVPTPSWLSARKLPMGMP
jgi:hypothetical protein